MSSLNSNDEVRVRFAPSPTGYLHVGGARTALYNYLFSRKHKGKFILRIEDTDQVRSTEQSLRMQVDDLVWLGLTWDEGPDPISLKDKGPHGPYRQSQRLHIYKEVAEKLIAQGKAYYCFLTDEELDAQREKAQNEGKFSHIESPYQDWPVEKALEKLKNGEKAVVRFKTKHLKKDYHLQDLIRGDVFFPSDMVGDFVLLRSDGMPVYNFCCVVDDVMMKITHVFRAEEHLPNTLRQLMIYEAMGYKVPQFGHVSLILGEDRQKLSKRHGATSCHEFQERGYLPEALKNFIALSGWSHPEGKEIIPESELIENFSVDRMNPAPAVFDEKKLLWMNSQYLRALSDEQIWQKVKPYLKDINLPESLINSSTWGINCIKTFKTYLNTFSEAIEFFKPLSDKEFQILPEANEVMAFETTHKVLSVWKAELEKSQGEYLSEEKFSHIQTEVQKLSGAKGKNLFQPIRVAVIGKPHGTDLKLLVPLIKRDSLVQRAVKCLAQIVNKN